MCCISGKELQGKQLAVKHPFKQALTTGHLAGLSLHKDTLLLTVQHRNQISKPVSCWVPRPHPYPAILQSSAPGSLACRRASWG